MAKQGDRIVSQFPYCLNLAPCDFLLFPDIKKALHKVKFESNQHVIEAVVAWCKELSKTGLSFVFQKWQEQWADCIALKGVVLKRIMYILKNKYIFLPRERLGTFVSLLFEQSSTLKFMVLHEVEIREKIEQNFPIVLNDRWCALLI